MTSLIIYCTGHAAKKFQDQSIEQQQKLILSESQLITTTVVGFGGGLGVVECITGKCYLMNYTTSVYDSCEHAVSAHLHFTTTNLMI